MNHKSIIKCFIFWVISFSFFPTDIFSAESKAPTQSTSASEQYKDHGWGKLDVLTNKTNYPALFYSSPRGLISMLPDGCIVRLRSLKTGFGRLYRAKQQAVAPVVVTEKPEAELIQGNIIYRLYPGFRAVAVVETKEASFPLIKFTQSIFWDLLDQRTVQLAKGGSGASESIDQGAKMAWTIAADTKDAIDPATKFIVSVVDGKYLTLSSEAAGGLLVGSDKNSYNVTLVRSNATDNELWELVEDPKAGDTLDTCHLKNKATGGFLTASMESTEGVTSPEETNLKNQIDELEKKYPYLKITYAKASGKSNSFDTAKGAIDITDVLDKKVTDNILDLSEGWVERLTGKSASSVGAKGGRTVKINYKEGSSNDEKLLIANENKRLHFEADLSKHPATPLKQQLNVLKGRRGAIDKLASSDVGRTGVNQDPLDMSQFSKVAIEPIAALGTDDDQGAEKDTIAGGSSRNLFIWAHKKPEFKGFGSDRIEGFGPGMLVTINPLLSQGFAWLEESLPVPGQGTILFSALAEKSDVHVCFSDNSSPRAAYRIAFGTLDNNKTIIYKNDVPVQQVDNLQNPAARITPGMIEQFWVSINKGFIIVGKGAPGTGIIMAWQDSAPVQNIQYVGFSSFKSITKVTNVQKLADAITPVAPSDSYVQVSASMQVGTISSPAWHKLPLSPADAGTVAFDVKGSSDATLVLANEQNQGYAITFGSDGNKTTKIVRLEDNTKDLYDIDVASLPLAGLKTGANSKFWVSLYKGQIVMGNGDVGKNPFCILVDSQTPKGISKIGFAGQASFQNLGIYPEIELGFEPEASGYTKSREFTAVKGALNIITPYNYRIVQEGPQVRFSDRLTGMLWNVGATPEPDAEYHFKLSILPTGEPNLELLFKDPSAEIVKTEKAIKLLSTGSDSAFKAAQTMAMATGPEIISNMISIAASAAFSLVGTGLAMGKAAEENKLMEMQALGGRYISTDRVEKSAGGTAQISPEDQNNRSLLVAKLEQVLQFQLGDAAQLDYATKQWDDVLRLITGFYVIDDAATKLKLTDGLKEIYNAVKSLELTTASLPLFNRMMDILIKAYNSPYITTVGDTAEEQQRMDWYVWINELSTRLLGSPALMQIGIDVDFKGEYLWLPDELPVAGSGSISFEAKAYNNIFVGFSENPYQVRNRSKRMYEIIIGMWDNKSTEIHRKSLGDAVAIFDHKQYPALSPDPAKFTKYWINIDKGIISIGVGELGENKICEWTDPYPAAPVKSVGLSNWLAEATFRNVKVGYALGTASAAPNVPADTAYDVGASSSIDADVLTDIYAEDAFATDEDLTEITDDVTSDVAIPVAKPVATKQPQPTTSPKPASVKSTGKGTSSTKVSN